MLDRMTHHCDIIETGNKSWGFEPDLARVRGVNFGRCLIKENGGDWTLYEQAHSHHLDSANLP